MTLFLYRKRFFCYNQAQFPCFLRILTNKGFLKLVDFVDLVDPCLMSFISYGPRPVSYEPTITNFRKSHIL